MMPILQELRPSSTLPYSIRASVYSGSHVIRTLTNPRAQWRTRPAPAENASAQGDSAMWVYHFNGPKHRHLYPFSLFQALLFILTKIKEYWWSYLRPRKTPIWAFSWNKPLQSKSGLCLPITFSSSSLNASTQVTKFCKPACHATTEICYQGMLKPLCITMRLFRLDSAVKQSWDCSEKH